MNGFKGLIVDCCGSEAPTERGISRLYEHAVRHGFEFGVWGNERVITDMGDELFFEMAYTED